MIVKNQRDLTKSEKTSLEKGKMIWQRNHRTNREKFDKSPKINVEQSNRIGLLKSVHIENKPSILSVFIIRG